MKTKTIISWLEKNPLRSQINNVTRNIRSNRKSAKGKSLTKTSFSTRVKEIFSVITFIKSRFFLIALAIFLVIVIVYNYDLYQSIQIERFPGDTVIPQKILTPGKFSTFIYFVDTKEEAGITYRYINSVSLLSIKEKKIDYLQINPYFQLNSDSNIVSYLNKSRTDTGQFDIDAVSNSIEETFGLYADRYLVVDTNKFTELLEELNYKYYFDLDYGEGYQNEFQINNKDLFLRYFFNTQELSKENVVLGQEELLLDFYGRKFGILDKYKFMTNFKDLEGLLYSNMSQGEFLTLINSLGGSKSVLDDSLSVKEGIINGDNLLIPNKVIIDEKIQQTLRDITVLAEQAEIEVYNATALGGLALNRTRQFQNIGINVVKYGNYPTFEETNTLHIVEEGSIDRFNNTINTIRAIIGDEDLEIIVGEYKENRTGDLILILGNI